MAATRPPKPDTKYVWNGRRWVRPKPPGSGHYVWLKNRGWKRKTDARGNPSNAALDWLATNYGLTEALLNADTTDPKTGFTMKEAFDQIRRDKITDGTRAAQIIARTDWWKNNGIESLKRAAEKKSQPGVWKRNIAAQMENIRQLLVDANVTIPDGALRRIAEDAYMFGFDNATVTKAVYKDSRAQMVDDSSVESQLRSAASNYGVTRSDDWYRDAARSITFKQASADSFTDQLKQEAISRTPYWAEQIKAGATVRDLAAGYIQDAQKLLEDPNIDLSHDLVKRALTSLDKDGKPAPVPLWQFEQMVRKDARWKLTQNAQQTYANVGTNLLRSFGMLE